jgi:uncharacterized repeat protein (TIGR03803 family)
VQQVLALAFAFLTLSLPTAAQTFSVLYSFQGNTDGSNPQAGLFLNAVYGTTFLGGDPTCACGTVFELLVNGTFTTLHTFVGTDGANPTSGLVADAYGNLYGTTSQGGSFGGGTVFKLAPPATLGGVWTESVLYNFTGASDGAHPYAGLAQDSAGNLYGTTNSGGAFTFGTVFKLDTLGNEVVLHSFSGSPDGAYPYAGVILDRAANLYGTTNGGGAFNSGTLFRLNATYKETVLHSFNGTTDGAGPSSALTLDATGNLFGTANQGGSGQEGTIFKLTNKGRFSVLHTFKGILQGANPAAGLILDSSGNLYGTTSEGGNFDDDGTIFELNPTTKTFSVLHTFASGNQGNYPYTGVISDSSGNLYGATESGGTARRGLLYRITTSVGGESPGGNSHRAIAGSTDTTPHAKRELKQ